MTPLKRSILIVTVLLSFIELCRADPPNGTVSFAFDASTAPVWELTDSYGFQQTIIGTGGAETALSFGIDLTQDERGSLFGSGGTVVNVGNDFVFATYSVKGKISGGDDNTHVTLNVRLSGEDFITGIDTHFGISLVYKLSVDAASGTLQGTAKGSAKFSGLGGGKISSEVQAGIPLNSNGAWTLQMNILPLSHLVGNSQIILPNGRILQAHLSGSYSTAEDLSTVKVSGVGISRGNSVRVVFDSSGVQQMQGRVMGQQVVIEPEPVTP